MEESYSSVVNTPTYARRPVPLQVIVAEDDQAFLAKFKTVIEHDGFDAAYLHALTFLIQH